jgi:hypothetical protein
LRIEIIIFAAPIDRDYEQLNTHINFINMKKNRLLILLLVICSSGMVRAQWDSVTKFNQVIDDIIPYNGNLFIAGNFTNNMGSTCYWSAYYNGSTITRHTNMIGGSGIRGMEVFGSDLYCVDALNYGFTSGVGMWDGSTWVDGGSTNYSHSVIYADGSDLYVVSDDDKVRKKTGTGAFTPFLTLPSSDGIGCIIRYGSKLIFAGKFTSIGGVAANNIAAWDGTNWTPLGTGISTGASCMAVYGGQLYVAGGLTSAGGTTVSKIARWNGTTWSSVGGGVTGTSGNGIRDMKTIGTGLLVVGDFNQMGTVTTSNVALWNGSSWTGLGLVHPDNFVNCVEVYGGKIYVGTFSFSHAHLFRYNGVVGIEEQIIEDDNMSIYPNPAKDKLVIGTKEIRGKSVLTVYNINGDLVMEKEIYNDINEIDISSFDSGMYVLKLMNENTFRVKKFIKE